MEYKISEVAKMFDTSSEGIRFFEKKGLLQGRRTENDYRIYEDRDIFSLIQCLSYSKLGFALSDARSMFFEDNAQSVQSRFKERIEETERNILHENAVLDCLRSRQAAIEQAVLNENRIIIERVPKRYFFSLEPSYQDARMPTDRTTSRERRKNAFDLLPAGAQALRFSLDKLKNDYIAPRERGFVIYDRHVEGFGLTLPPEAVCYPEAICATCSINIGVNAMQYDFTSFFINKLLNEGLTPNGDLIVIYTWFSFCESERQRYCTLMVPIRQDNRY